VLRAVGLEEPIVHEAQAPGGSEFRCGHGLT
jgi:hypothetical protein